MLAILRQDHIVTMKISRMKPSADYSWKHSNKVSFSEQSISVNRHRAVTQTLFIGETNRNPSILSILNPMFTRFNVRP